jgi:hypothetical protein
VNTTEQRPAALEHARRPTDEWDNGEHELMQGHITVFGDTALLHSRLWSENCHVADQVMLQGPSVQ